MVTEHRSRPGWGQRVCRMSRFATLLTQRSRFATRLTKRICVLFSVTVGFVLVGAVLLWTRAEASVVEGPLGGAALAADSDYRVSYVFRFTPTLQTFNAFTVPTVGAAPDGLAVYNGPSTTEVWFAESGADQIGRLVYTSTADYIFQEYGLPAGSRPLNVVVDSSGDAWFTENGRSRIGYVDASTGITHEFPISTTDVAPVDLDIAPDGSIWFTERATDHIGQLVVTSTTDFHVREFYVEYADKGLAGVLAQENDKIWAILGNAERIVRLKPSVPDVYPTGALDSIGYPSMLASGSGGSSLWFTELRGNHVSLFIVSTLEWGLRYTVPTTNSRPYNLDLDSNGDVWFGEQLGGKIGRLANSTRTFTEFPVPLQHAHVQGLDVDANDVVWFVADTWYRVSLPVVLR